MREITLNRPFVRGNHVIFSWTPVPGFKGSHYTVEYPTLFSVTSSPGKLAEAYFPLCLAFAAMGPVRIHLPVRLPAEVIARWQEAIADAGAKLFARPPRVEFAFSDSGPEYREIPPEGKTALFFGGGTESLLTLARLLKEGTRPILASFGGPNWPGSNPQDNPHKFMIDETVARDLGLTIFRVYTDFKDIFTGREWAARLKPGVRLLNALVSLPAFVSFMLPVCEDLGIARIVSGNEKMNFPDEYFCFSPGMTRHLETAAHGVRYQSWLEEILKEEVCYELYREHPEIARYQYSCWRNRCRRWCYRCQSCLEFYMFAINAGLDPLHIGIEKEEVRRNAFRLVEAAACSPEGRPGEIWMRMRHYPRLRANYFTRFLLDAVAVRAALHWKFFRHFSWLVPPELVSGYHRARLYFGKMIPGRRRPAPAAYYAPAPSKRETA